MQTTSLFAIPLHLSAVCRRVHAVLTGARAAQRAEGGGGVDAEGMREVWEGLERCWDEFEGVRRGAGGGGADAGDVERFVSGWQVGCGFFCGLVN